MAGVEKKNQTPPDTDSKSVNETDTRSMQMSVPLLVTILSIVDMMEIVRAMAIEYLGLDFSTTCDDIAALKFIAGDSLLSLKHACETEKIGCFLQCVFKESGAANVLGRGSFRWKFYIRKMSPEEYSHYRQLIETKEEQNKIWGLFAEELDPTELFSTFQDMGLVGEKQKDKMMPLISRKEKLDYLIGRLVRKKQPDQGFKILLAHCVKNDYQFLSKINEIYGGDAGNSNVGRKRIEDECLPGQKLFTACVTLRIHGSESAIQMDIDIQDRKWHNDTPGKIHQDALNRCLPVLVRNLDVTLVCMYIQQRGVLDDVTVRDVLDQKTTSDKNNELIKKIQQRDPSTYQKFKKCLVQAKQAYLKDELEKKEEKIAREMKEEEIVIMGLAPDWETTEEKAITTGLFLPRIHLLSFHGEQRGRDCR